MFIKFHLPSKRALLHSIQMMSLKDEDALKDVKVRFGSVQSLASFSPTHLIILIMKVECYSNKIKTIVLEQFDTFALQA
jgi:hypothetical protein